MVRYKKSNKQRVQKIKNKKKKITKFRKLKEQKIITNNSTFSVKINRTKMMAKFNNIKSNQKRKKNNKTFFIKRFQI